MAARRKKEPQVGFGGKTFGKHWKNESLRSRLAYDFDIGGARTIAKDPKVIFHTTKGTLGLHGKKFKGPTLHQRTTVEGRRDYVKQNSKLFYTRKVNGKVQRVKKTKRKKRG